MRSGLLLDQLLEAVMGGKILLVEDEDIVAGFIKTILASKNLDVTRTSDAESAWTILETRGAEFGTILLDRHLPHMDGMTLMRRIKDHPALCHIPIIMETASDDVNSIQEGLNAGAYYYLTKPLQPRLLLAVVDTALTHYHHSLPTQDSVQTTTHSLRYLIQGIFRFHTLTEARTLAYDLAHSCPHPTLVAVGLLELFVNAVEHGNLGIRYEEKTKLVLEGHWEQEVERRLMLSPYRERHVTVTLVRDAQAVALTIHDQGEGFDWQQYLEFDAKRAFDPNGRGIALARKSAFDSVRYEGKGNQVVVSIRQPEPIERIA